MGSRVPRFWIIFQRADSTFKSVLGTQDDVAGINGYGPILRHGGFTAQIRCHLPENDLCLTLGPPDVFVHPSFPTPISGAFWDTEDLKSGFCLAPKNIS